MGRRADQRRRQAEPGVVSLTRRVEEVLPVTRAEHRLVVNRVCRADAELVIVLVELPRPLRGAVHESDREQAIWGLRAAAAALAEEAAEPRFVVTLMSVLAGIAVSLAAVGLYGVLAYAVARRGRELAVRMAVGADARSAGEWAILGEASSPWGGSGLDDDPAAALELGGQVFGLCARQGLLGG